MSFVPCASAPPPPFAGATLVVACDGWANVAALCADLVITTLPLARAGYLLTPHVLPCVGNDALGDAPAGALSTSLEVFARPGLALLQQRSPARLGAQRLLAADVVAWARAAGFSRLVALAGGEPAASPAAALASPFAVHSSLEGTWGGVPLAESRTPPWTLLQAAQVGGLAATALVAFAAEGDNTGHAAQLASRLVEELRLEAPAGWRAPASWATLDG